MNAWRDAVRDVRGVLLVAVVYVYFLLFAQFGFVRLVGVELGGAGRDELHGVLAVMGVAGLAASAAAGLLLRSLASELLLRIGLAGSAAIAFAATWGSTALELRLVAGGIGVFLGLLTVSLATHLRKLVCGPRYGLGVGVGTGVAYWLCNVPVIFEADPRLQAALAGAAALAGLLLLGRGAGRSGVADPRGGALGRGDFRGLGLASLVLSFLALVWIDSAAFNIIQQTPGLKSSTWGSDAQRLMQGAAHLLAAIAAGMLIDRGRFRSLLVAAFALFVVAFALLGAPAGRALGGPLYAVGISLYSVALVAFPAYRGDEAGLVPRRLRAAAVYGLAGWVGSALGIGMAERLHTIPPLFLVAAGAVLAVSLRLAGSRSSASLRVLERVYGPALGLGLLAVSMQAVVAGEATPPAGGEDAVERGRRLYVGEGCINCHSQYIRPGTRDEELWGPFRPLEEGERPPLLGNRRQGPDLRNVGNRRSAAWLRLHLEDPRSLSPESRMPSYAHLFAPEVAGGPRPGDDLVAYLASLGAETSAERYASTLRGPVPAEVLEHAGSPRRGDILFHRICAPCHGIGGEGGGPLSAELERPAPSLRTGRFALVSWGPGVGSLEEGLARLVRFGMPGSPMPGHETSSGQEIADLVAYVLSGADGRADLEPRPEVAPW